MVCFLGEDGDRRGSWTDSYKLLYDDHSSLRPLGFAELLPIGPIADTVYRCALYAERVRCVHGFYTRI